MKSLSISKCSGMICILPVVRECYDKGCQTEVEEEDEEGDIEDYDNSNLNNRDQRGLGGERGNKETPQRPFNRSQGQGLGSNVNLNNSMRNLGSSSAGRSTPTTDQGTKILV